MRRKMRMPRSLISAMIQRRRARRANTSACESFTRAPWSQCSGSMTFWCGSGSGDPCLWLMDPDPAVFVIDLQDANKKLFFLSFSAYYFLNGSRSGRSKNMWIRIRNTAWSNALPRTQSTPFPAKSERKKGNNQKFLVIYYAKLWTKTGDRDKGKSKSGKSSKNFWLNHHM